MAEAPSERWVADLGEVFAPPGSGPAATIMLVREGQEPEALDRLAPEQRAWVQASGFTGAAKRHVVVPAADGRIAAALLGTGRGDSGEPAGPHELLVGHLAAVLPPGLYRLADPSLRPELTAVAWGLGAYRFHPLKTAPPKPPRPRLEQPEGSDPSVTDAIVQGVWLGRDLINLPAGHLGPEELELAVRRLAALHGAHVESIVGEQLLARNFPMIHAVGRASPRPPRLIDLRWQAPGGSAEAPRITVVGKGICFDTGGLDIKPSSAMLLMKKDMGGAATALAFAHMAMSLGLDLRLRVLIAAAENSVAGNAFRPGDVLRSRAGKTVEIGNTDAEGRLVLADALALADEEAPDALLTFATLTGAARTALGPDLPPVYTDDDTFAAAITAAGLAVGDPVWRLPFWSGYERTLDSEVADMSNVSEGPFAGSITAALFLRRFVSRARRFAHFDIYGWRPSPRALGPKGGEPQGARLLLELARTGRLA